MTKDFLNKYWPLLCAVKEGKKLQFSHDGQNKWTDFAADDSPSFCFEPEHYRVKPAPKFRAWYVHEVPIGALLKTDNNVIVTILSVDAQFSCIKSPAVILSRVKGTYHPDGHYFLADLVTSLCNPVHSIDGGKTWKRCGVWE